MMSATVGLAALNAVNGVSLSAMILMIKSRFSA